MATYKKGINGPLSGKVGNVIASSWRGINYFKGLNSSVSKPATPAQLYQRALLAMVSAWLKPLRDLIWVGFQVFSGTKTPMNGAISFIMTEATIRDADSARLDFSKVIFSRGELLMSIITEVLYLESGSLQVKWRDVAGSVFAKGNDMANFVIYNEAKEKFVTFENITERAVGEVTLRLPKGFKGDELHCYMHYVSLDGKAVSTSIYFGF